MRLLRADILRGVHAALKLLASPALYLLLFASILVWAAAYQYKTTYAVDVGGLLDDAYVSGFHDKETTPEFDYRWSTAHAAVSFPGVGNQPVNVSITHLGLPPAGGSSPAITVTVRGQLFSLQTYPERRTDTLFVPRVDPLQGNLTVEIDSPTFNEGTADRPGRDLGVNIDSVAVAPADYGLRPVVVPPVDMLFGLLAGLLLIVLATAVATLRSMTALGAGTTMALIAFILLLVARLELGLLAPSLPSLGLWCLGLAVLARTLLAALVRGNSRPARLTLALGASAFVLAFALRFGGLTYPQFLTSDLILNVHNAQEVIRGVWVFSEPLPNGIDAPYPPALYALIVPLSWLFGSGEEALSLLLKWVASLLDAFTCLALAWAGYRLWRGTFGGWAALFYAVIVAPFDLFSAGNYTNLFAQSVLNIGMLVGLVYVNERTGKGGRDMALLSVAGACFFLTALGHYGMMLGTLLLAGLFGVWLLVAGFRGVNTVRGWKLVGSMGLVYLLSFVVYYRNVLDLIANHFSRMLGGTPAVEDTPPAMRSLALDKLGNKIVVLVGGAQVLSAASGAATGLALSSVAWAWLGSWLIVGGLFAVLDQVLGDAIRWYYLVAAALALLGGRFMGLVARRGRLGTWFACLLFAVMLWYLLTVWVGDFIFFRYHTR